METKTTNVGGTGRKSVYNFIVEFIKENGYSPSVREISAGTNLSSTATVCYHLEKLKMMGKIDMKENVARSIRVLGYEYRKVDRGNK